MRGNNNIVYDLLAMSAKVKEVATSKPDIE